MSFPDFLFWLDAIPVIALALILPVAVFFD